MDNKKTNKQWEFDDAENQPQESKKDNQDIFSAENWFVEGEQAIETPVAEKQSWEDYIVTEDEVVIPVVANVKDNQPTVKDNENKEVSATAKPEESKNKKSSKKSLIISLCAVAVTLSIVLGVVFIPDWDDDIPIDTDIPFEEQVNDSYIPADDETNFFEDVEEFVSDEDLMNLDEELTTSDNETNYEQTEEKTTRKNGQKDTTTNIAKTETTTNNNKKEDSNTIILEKVVVTFNANGGAVSPANTSVTYNSSYDSLPTPTKTGYEFIGWYTSSTGGSKITSSSKVNNSTNHTLYARWEAKTYTVSFNANGGIVLSTSKSVTYDSSYGSLPTPTRNYYTFDGWYTSSTGGSKVTFSSKVNNSANHTLYAHWKQNSVSGWVSESSVPLGAQIVDEKWTYTKTETKESTNSSLSGWTETGSYWKQTGTGTHYYASFPNGFNTNDSRYSKYSGSAISSYENTNNKRVVSGSSTYTYVYYHWCYALSGYHTETNREVGSYNGQYINGCGYTTIWECFESSTNATTYADKCYKFTGHSTYSYWWYKVPVYKQTYTNYQKVYQYKKVTTGLESSTQVIADGQISNVKKYVKYRAK